MYIEEYWSLCNLYRRNLCFTKLFFLSPTLTSPDAADSSSFDVQLGDIILTATDGLFDNMPDYMILQELKKLKVHQNKTIKLPVLIYLYWLFQTHPVTQRSLFCRLAELTKYGY